MLRLPSFEYLAPKTLAEATSIMSDHGPEAMYVAGGTDLYPNMKRRQFEPKALIGLRGIPAMHGLSNGGGLVIGGGRPLSQGSPPRTGLLAAVAQHGHHRREPVH